MLTCSTCQIFQAHECLNYPPCDVMWCDWLSGNADLQALDTHVHSAHTISVTFFLQQENAIQIMELRNYFSLFCVHQESQLIFAYLPITSHILGTFINSQVQSHREVRIVGCASYMMWSDRGKMREQWKSGDVVTLRKRKWMPSIVLKKAYTEEWIKKNNKENPLWHYSYVTLQSTLRLQHREIKVLITD